MLKHTVHSITFLPRAVLLLGSVAFMLSSCSKVTVAGQHGQDSSAITFTDVAAKSVVTDPSGIGSFSVWGWRTDNSSATPTPAEVFSATEVSRTGTSWTYEGTRYWMPENTYDFYALYPDTATLTTPQSGNQAAESAAYDAAGNLTITNFDSTKGHDLMTASSTGMLGSDPQPVAFTFSHELALVSFVGQSEGSNAQIISIKFSGVKNIGNYNASLSPEWTVSGSHVVYEEASFELPSVPTDIFGEIMVIPQSVNDDYKLTIEYEYKGIEGTSQKKEISLPDSVTKWEAGKSYRYTFTIVGDYILFSTPEVNAWSESSGGIIIVA